MKSKTLSVGMMLVALIVWLMIGPLAGTATMQGGGIDVTYTTGADFERGTLVNVDRSAPYDDQLRLNLQTTRPFPFVNVAASGRGTLVRINADTGEVLGEYRSSPQGRGGDPSRTTVDLFGNVWAGNRGESGLINGVPHGSAVKVGLVVEGMRVDADGTPNPQGDFLAPPFGYNTCVDRDGDGLIKTSRGLGDVRPWPDVTDGVGGTDGSGDGLVEDADDECILIYQRLPEALQVRHVSVDANNNVWVGNAFGPLAPRFHQLDGNTGAIITSPGKDVIGCGGYGGLVDGNGMLWSASRGPLLRYDPVAGTGTCLDVRDSYGMGIDTNGFIWISMWNPNSVAKLSPDGVVEPGFPTTTGDGLSSEDGDRGVAITPADDHVWVAKTQASTVARLDNDGNLLKAIPVGCGPTGVAVDANGKVWVTNGCSDNAMRIDPHGGEDGLGEVDLTVALGPGAGPYNYSDMTGIVAIGTTSPQGTWSVVEDAGTPGAVWNTITWNTEAEGSEPSGTHIVVEARTADAEAGLGGATFQAISNGVPFALAGQFIEVRVALKAAADGTGPLLSDIRIQTAAPTPTSTPRPTATRTPLPTPTATPAPVQSGVPGWMPLYLILIVLAIILIGIFVWRVVRRRRAV